MPQSKSGLQRRGIQHRFSVLKRPGLQGQTGIFLEIDVGFRALSTQTTLRRRAEPLDAKARQPVPAQRSSTRGASTPASISAAVSATTRYQHGTEHARPHGQFKVEERPAAAEVLQRLPGRTANGQFSSFAASAARPMDGSERRDVPACRQPEQPRASKSASGQPAAVSRASTFFDRCTGQHPSLTICRPPGLRAAPASRRRWPPLDHAVVGFKDRQPLHPEAGLADDAGGDVVRAAAPLEQLVADAHDHRQ